MADMKTISAVLMALVLFGCGGGSSDQTAAPKAAAIVPDPVPAPVPAPAPPKPLGKVLFVGDSITQFWDWGGPFDASPHLSELVPTGVNVGYSGDTTELMVPRFNEGMKGNPDVVVILGGTNDIRQFNELSIDHITDMADRAAQAGARVLICTVPPSNIWIVPSVLGDQATNDSHIKIWNDKLKVMAASRGIKIVEYHDALINSDGTQKGELFFDQIHPNAAGYNVMWPVLKAALDGG
jgi:lysophospholipase L1-like esterase